VSDLVERLREAWDQKQSRRVAVEREAADRIEELEAGRNAVLEEAARVLDENFVEQAARLSVRYEPPETLGGWRDRVRSTAIRALKAKSPSPVPVGDKDSVVVGDPARFGGGIANEMRALGYRVNKRADTEYGSLWEMKAPLVSDTVWLAKDEAEGWEKAHQHWCHASVIAALSPLVADGPNSEVIDGS
jgi:hypothetical protein